MKFAGIVWGGELPLIRAACDRQQVTHAFHASTSVRSKAALQTAIADLKDADIVIIHPSSDPLWDEILSEMPEGIPVIPIGYNPEGMAVATVPAHIAATASAYYVYGGQENIDALVRFLRAEVGGEPVTYNPPCLVLWDGIYHPDAPAIHTSAAEYFGWRGRRHDSLVGILFYRLYWSNRDLRIIDALIRRLEEEHDVIAVFCIGTGDADLGARPGDEVISEYFAGSVDILINLQSVTLSKKPGQTVRALRRLNVPVIHPVIIYNRRETDWLDDSGGLTASETGWAVVMPEFMGMTGMIPIGAQSPTEPSGMETEWHDPIEDRIQALGNLASHWVRLQRKKPGERKIAFILNNAPCASIEATVGTAAHLDALESLAVILARLRDEGYRVTVPADGKELIKTILERKALSEFRWTSVSETIARGGALARLGPDVYMPWFTSLPEKLIDDLSTTWGEPPGREIDGVPPGMVHDGRIVITGVRYGNAVVCTQPKRGCTGSRCDGQVCRILHDPLIPPPYQYLATYRYLTTLFCADVIVHVGTHGTLEFLPGKSVALSSSCLPDAVLGKVPLLYLYNTDNPPEGTIAKRRVYATLIGHMQTLMTGSELYGNLSELSDRIDEYHRVSGSDPARAHALEHVISELIQKNGMEEEINNTRIREEGGGITGLITAAHDALTRIYNTQIPLGMHIFGSIPAGEKRAEYITGLLRFGQELRLLMVDLQGLDLVPKSGELALLRLLDEQGKEFTRLLLNGRSPRQAASETLGNRLVKEESILLETVAARIHELSDLIGQSDELTALQRGLNGEYISPGPSGLVSRGRTDVLPTGRNFYSLDPHAVPTEAAFRVGRKLAETLLEKFVREEGRYPETVAVYWMASDIMWSDGESLGKLLHLMGMEPVWRQGRVRGIRPVPLSVLRRPRIDISVRASGILRDCFYNCIEMLDDAVCMAASLDEPDEMNYIRKHNPEKETRPASRIFGSRAGTYGMGVNLAIYASAWKEESELADIYISWNGYSYGRDQYGISAHENLVSQFRHVDVTFNKTATDEYDLLGCCCYFGAHGGLTIAAETVKGEKIATYYGDTRDPSAVEVRTLAEEVTRVVRTRLLNPRYIDGLKEHGYAGAGELSRRIGRVYGWDATTGQVRDWIFDDIARTFLIDEDNRKFFEENNPYAMEEIARRLLEAHHRGIWRADPAVIEGVQESYLLAEGMMEDRMDGNSRMVQGGSIDIYTVNDVRSWQEKMVHHQTGPQGTPADIKRIEKTKNEEMR